MKDRKFDVLLSLLACIMMMFLSAQSLANAFSLPAMYWLLNGAFGLYILVRDLSKYGITVSLQ